MKKKLFENVGGNMFKLKINEDVFGSDSPRPVPTVKYTLPSHWASYYINGDSSGLEPEEIKDADAAIRQIKQKLGASVECVDAEEIGFKRSNDFNNIAGDVSSYTFHVFKKSDDGDEAVEAETK